MAVAGVAIAASAPQAPTQADAHVGHSTPGLPPSRWELKEGAPPGVSKVLERMKRQRGREFEAQVRAVELAEKDLNARKSGRVVKELKAPEGWRAVPARAGGGYEYAFKTPQVKGREVVKAEGALEQARRRLAEIGHPEYLAKPALALGELQDGAAGTVSFTVLQQVSGTEAVVRVVYEPPAPAAGGRAPARVDGPELYLSDFPAQDYPPGMLIRDWTVEGVGTKAFQGDNGRQETAPHARSLEWRKWVEVARPADKR